MKPIRVLLAGMPRMLTDLVKGIVVSQQDLELAGEIVGNDAIARAVDDAAPDVLVTGTPPTDQLDYTEALYRQPRLRIVAIATDGRQATLYELRPQTVLLGEVSPTSLIAAIRGQTSSTMSTAL